MTGEHDPDAKAQPDFPPLSSRVQVEFGARSRVGRQRTTKTDHYLILRLGRHQEILMTSLPRAQVPLPFDEFGYGMLVADGLGDTESGEIASRLAIRTFVYLYLLFGRWNLRIDERIAREVVERAERFYRHVDGVVTAQHRTEPASPEMQTTLTAIYSAGSDCLFAHVGHSRAYLCREGKLAQLTRDHTLAAEASAQEPELSGPSAARDMQHILTDAIGSRAALLKVDIEHFQLLDGDVVLLCTNGLTDMVEGPRIEAVLNSMVTPDEQCQSLVEMALDAGGQDDVTAVIAHYRIPAPGREQGSAGTRDHTARAEGAQRSRDYGR